MKRLVPLLLVCACAGSLVDHDGASSTTPGVVVTPPTQTCLDTCVPPAGTKQHCDGDVCGYECQNGTLKTPLAASPCSVPTAVAAGGNHTCALAGGQVLCWGDNGLKQLGSDTPAASGTPLQVPGLPADADLITASTTQTCAHFRNGAVWCWGAAQVPHAISGIAGAVSAVAAGAAHACAATDAGVFCWGDNSVGQLGAAPNAGQAAALRVNNVPPAKVLAAGVNHTCAGDTAGLQLWCWGDNGAFQDGTSAPSPSLPAVVPGAGASLVGAGENHTCSIGGGQLKCWGANGNQQVDGSATDVNQPKGESVSQPPTGVAGGAGHTCAIESGGASVSCWGLNDKGQLGTSDFSNRTNPFRIGNLTDIDRITAGSKHTCVLTKAASLLCWGANESGQLGTGTVSGGSSTPQPVTGL
jgi:alpha-tubulin suppressor-like RCC1 family protein